MSILMIIGVLLGVGTIVTDRHIHKIPNKIAIALFSAAVILIIAGMIVSRTAA